MIIKRPSIFIYVNNPDAVFLRDVCAGIEEEGVFYEIKEMETALPDELAWNAANDSMLGSGVGISGKGIAMQMRGLPKGRNTERLPESHPGAVQETGGKQRPRRQKAGFQIGCSFRRCAGLHQYGNSSSLSELSLLI